MCINFFKIDVILTAFNGHASSEFYSFLELQRPVEKIIDQAADSYSPHPLISKFLHSKLLVYLLCFVTINLHNNAVLHSYQLKSIAFEVIIGIRLLKIKYPVLYFYTHWPFDQESP